METPSTSGGWNRGRLIRPLIGSTVMGVAVLIAVAVVALHILTDADPAAWWERISAGWIGAAVGLFVLGNLLVGHRFMALFPHSKGERPSTWGVGSLFFAGNVFTLAVPGPVGEIAAVAAMRARWGVDVRDAFATTIHTRLVGLFASALVAVSATPWIPLDAFVGKVLALAGLLVAVAAVVLGVLTLKPALLRGFGHWMSGQTSAERTGPVAWVLRRGGKQLALFAESLSDVGSAPLSSWIKVVGWSLVMQLVHLGALFCACQALALMPALPAMLLARGMGSLTILAAFLLPGGMGSYEVVFMGCMVGAGGLTVVESGLLVLSMRIIHLLGLACSGVAFAFWAKILLSEEVASALQAEGVELPSDLHG